MTRPADLWPEAGPSHRRDDASSWHASRRYVVVVDAGSSGSRMQLYSWKDPRVDRAQRERNAQSVKTLPTVEKGTHESSGRDWQLKVEPGLSSFGNHPDDLEGYLKPLFDHAKSIVPPEAQAETPVYVLATAGMRLLPSDERKKVLDKTCSYIQTQTPFHMGVGGCTDHIQVISGEEEGLLGWIAINYLMDGFHFKAATSGQIEKTEGKSTFGFLDMGGASTQIAFEPSAKAQLQKPDSQNDLTPVALRMLDGTDVVHNVFVTTFLGFGTNKARDRYLEGLSSQTSSISDISANEATAAIATSEARPDPCLPKGLQEPANANHPTLLGTGSFDQCLKSLSPLLDKDAACKRPPCLFHGVHVPAIDFSVNHFIGVSEYWFSSNDVFQLGGAYDFVSFQKAAQAYCGTPWDKLKTQLSEGTVFGKQVTQDRLEMQCFKSAWMATVLHEGIGLPRITDPGGKGDGRVHADDAQQKADQKNLFQSVNDVGGLAVSWTLGKAVLEASKDIPPLPAEGPHSAPVHGETPISQPHSSTNWQDKFSQPWQRPTEALLSGRHRAHIPLGAVIAVFIVTGMFLIMCLCLRGRGAKAIKRRAAVRDLFKSPCSGVRKSGQGDYTLANMEEGSNARDVDGLVEETVGSDLSDEEDSPAGKSKHKRRRSSGNGFLSSMVLVPLQKLGLAMGFKNVIAPSRAPIALGQRRPTPPRYPMRHHAIALPISMSQPASPRAYSGNVANSVAAAAASVSRPGSRSGATFSPRGPDAQQQQVNSYFGTWPQPGGTHPHGPSSLGSSTATATASARSSRAASPAFGHPNLPIVNGQTNGQRSRNGANSGFARKAWEDPD